jgi:hypothetical protein
LWLIYTFHCSTDFTWKQQNMKVLRLSRYWLQRIHSHRSMKPALVGWDLCQCEV